MSYTLGALVQRNHAVQPEIRHLSDLARQSAIKYGVIEGGSTEHFFRYSTITSYAEMWRQMHADEAAGRVLTIAEGVNRVMSSPADRPWAFIGESYTLNYHAGLSYCRLKVVQDDVIQRYLGLALPLNSQLRGRLDTAVLMLLEEGELAKLQMKWWYRQFQCDRLPNN